MTVSVTFAVTDNVRPEGAPLESALVRVFSADGETFVTQGTTDSEGLLILELEDATTYWVRFFLPTYEFPSRLTIDVDSEAASNTFDVRAAYLMEHVPSANPYLCRASGYVRGPDWAPRPGVRMTFSMTGEPRVLGGEVMVGGDIITESDAGGWIEIELPRNSSYDCVVGGLDDEVQRVQVPDAGACPITDLIWPYIQLLEYGSEAVTVVVDGEESVTATVTLSSGVTTPFEMDNDDRFYARSFVTFTISDESVCAVTWDSDDNLVIHGKKAGATTITAEIQSSAEAARLPAPTRSLAVLSVTVTEA